MSVKKGYRVVRGALEINMPNWWDDEEGACDVEQWIRDEYETGYAYWGWMLLHEEAMQRLASGSMDTEPPRRRALHGTPPDRS